MVVENPGRFGPGRFGPISGVSRFGPIGAGRFGPISKVGRFRPILGVRRFGLIYLFGKTGKILGRVHPHFAFIKLAKVLYLIVLKQLKNLFLIAKFRFLTTLLIFTRLN